MAMDYQAGVIISAKQGKIGHNMIDSDLSILENQVTFIKLALPYWIDRILLFLDHYLRKIPVFRCDFTVYFDISCCYETIISNIIPQRYSR